MNELCPQQHIAIQQSEGNVVDDHALLVKLARLNLEIAKASATSGVALDYLEFPVATAFPTKQG